ncbi:spore coat protein [Bacillota bacterium Lsc_1132]
MEKKVSTTDHSSHLDSYHSFLQSLVGEEVQVYKGGPECKMGKLLDVQSDYICVCAQNNNNNNNDNNGDQNQNQNQNQNNQNQNQATVVYYRTEHLQSISENTKNNSMPRYQGQEATEVEFHTGENFSQLVNKLVGSYVQVNQGGPESKTGYLVDIAGNYMALLTDDDGVVYYNIHHIKSISESNQNNQNQDNNSQEVTIPEYFKAEDFHQLFGQMSHKWVSINRGGPQALEGVLVQSAGGHYTLINNDEVLRINPFHIKSISCGPKGALKQINTNSNEQQNDPSNQNGQNTSNHANFEDESSSSSESSGYRRSRSSNRSSGHRGDRSSNRRSSSSARSHRRIYPREKVVKTYDYIWNPRR